MTLSNHRDYCPRMAKSFREALLSALEHSSFSLKAIADGSEVSYEQLKKVAQRETASTNVDDARKVAEFLGFTLDEFLDASDLSDRIRLVEIYNSLSHEEVEMLKVLATSRS